MDPDATNSGSSSGPDAVVVAGPHQFPITRWTLVGRAGLPDEPARREAMDVLLRRYLPAMRACLRSRGIPGDRADDLLQSFVADKVIGRNILAAADRSRGRFRAFLMTALNNFARNQSRDESAEKRAPERQAVSLEAVAEDYGHVPA